MSFNHPKDWQHLDLRIAFSPLGRQIPVTFYIIKKAIVFFLSRITSQFAVNRKEQTQCLYEKNNPLGYPDAAPLHALPTAPHPGNPQVLLAQSTPTVPWPDLGVPVLHRMRILASCQNLTVEHVRRNTGISFFFFFPNRQIFGKL